MVFNKKNEKKVSQTALPRRDDRWRVFPEIFWSPIGSKFLRPVGSKRQSRAKLKELRALRLKFGLKFGFKIRLKILRRSIINKILNLNFKLNFEGCKPDQENINDDQENINMT